MMFLSRLILNSRSRAARRDLGDCHDLHRTIMSAFPQAQSNDAGARAQFDVLFRIDIDRRTGKVVLLVQSSLQPDWSKLPPDYLLDAHGETDNPACKSIDETYGALQMGTRLRFRLRANPTRKIETKSAPDGRKRNGKRVELYKEEDQIAWLQRKAENAGFRLLGVRINPDALNLRAAPENKASGQRNHKGQKQGLTFGSVLFEGELAITDMEKFQAALASGIGPGKAYGFGLLSITRAIA
jgi:CRISPR system Cascade subunit CasE